MARRIISLLLVMLAMQACSFQGYKFNGASLDYTKYKTVSFSDFPIRAALVYPPLQQLFENKMRDMVTQQTRLRVVDTPNSDLRDRRRLVKIRQRREVRPVGIKYIGHADGFHRFCQL